MLALACFCPSHFNLPRIHFRWSTYLVLPFDAPDIGPESSRQKEACVLLVSWDRQAERHSFESIPFEHLQKMWRGEGMAPESATMLKFYSARRFGGAPR